MSGNEVCASLVLGFAALLGVGLTAAPARAQTSGANQTHDPSRMIESDGKFYFCSTGGGCASSTDGLAWKATGLRIPIPSWSTTYMSGGNQGVWAPDIVYYNDKYYIYYSFCGVPAANAPCVIGLYTTPTLDSTSASYKLTDQGMVVNNPMNTATYQFSTIDPGPIIDTAGNLWTSWGSGFGKDQTKTQLWLTRLDTTGLPLTTDPAYQPPTVLGHALETGRREGSYVHYHNGYYYLFWNEGSCCDGTTSTYTIWVARSQGSITGPFSGTKVFYAGSGDIHGPGHMGIYSACGVERFTYHYYPTATSVLGENELAWGSDDWPVAGAVSTTPLTPCGDPGSGGTGGSGAGTGGGTGIGTGGSSGTGGAAGRGTGGASGGLGGAAAGGNSGSSNGTGGETVSGSGGAIGSGGSPTSGSGGTAAAGTGGATTGHGPDGSTASTSNGAGCACDMSGGGGGVDLGAAGAPWLLIVAAWRRRRDRIHDQFPGCRRPEMNKTVIALPVLRRGPAIAGLLVPLLLLAGCPGSLSFDYIPTAGNDGGAGGAGGTLPTSCANATSVLQINCGVCHTSPPQVVYANLDLMSATAIGMLVGQAAYTGASGACAGMGFILNKGPLPATGIFIDKINNHQACGASMPFNLPLLSSTDIACLQAWANGLVSAAGPD